MSSMRHLLPLSCTVLLIIFVVLGWILFENNVGALSTLIQQAFSQDLAQNPLIAMGYEFFRRIFWWIGVNGNSLVFAWREAFYIPAQMSNELEGTSFIFTSEFFDAISVSLLGLAISIWVFSTHPRMRSISACELSAAVAKFRLCVRIYL